MTDDARTSHEAHDAEGRTPSDFTDGGHGTPESRRADSSGPEFSRPEFLPAGEGPAPAEQPRNEGWTQLGAPPARWGDRRDQPELVRHDDGYDDRDVPPGEGGQDPGFAGEHWGDPSGRPRHDTAVFEIGRAHV